MKEAFRTSPAWFSHVPVGSLAWAAGVLMLFSFVGNAAALEPEVVERYRKEIKPILAKYCFDCHADGAKKGNVSFDAFKSDEELTGKRELWHAVLKNTRAQIMPPARRPRPTAEEQQVF
jgi:hypothetical protein